MKCLQSILWVAVGRTPYYSFKPSAAGGTGRLCRRDQNVAASSRTTTTAIDQRADSAVEPAMLNLRTGGFKQLCETVYIRSTGVADHKIAEPALAPGCQVERELFFHAGIITPFTPHRSFLEHEHRNLVFAHSVDQMCSGSLTEIRHAASEKGKLGVLNFRQIEAEGDLALKPRLYRVAISGQHIDSRGAG